jgi:alcohol dehydrogenase class IV
MITFEFATANRIIFGVGAISALAEGVKKLGRNVLVIHGFPDWEATIFENLADHLIDEWSQYKVSGEPTIESVRVCAQFARDAQAKLIIGIGGGSALDMSKAAAAMVTNPGDVLEYLEVIGAGRKLLNDPLPVIAIPTTSGTGSEVTRNAVIGSEEHLQKVSLRHEKMLPAMAIVDPALTVSLPPAITAYTGLDALVQLIEPLVSRQANPLTDALCLDGIQRVRNSLPGAYQDGKVLPKREDMALASLFGGLALANAKLGAVHGIAGPFGGMYPAPHGAICGRLLAPVMRQNIRLLRKADNEPVAFARYQEIASLLINNPEAEPEAATEWVEQLVAKMEIPGLAAYGFVPDAVPELIRKAQESSSMKGNPIGLTDEQLEMILTEAM